NLIGFLFEFLIIALLGITAIYILYRNTDWPFVKERVGLIVGSFILISVLSIGLVILAESEETALGDFLDGIKDRVEDSIPFRALIVDDKVKDIYKLEGTIISVEKDGRDYIIEVQSESKIVRLMLEKRFGVFNVGDKIKLEYEVDGSEQDIEMIQKIN